MSGNDGDKAREMAEAARREADAKPWARDYCLDRASEWDETARRWDETARRWDETARRADNGWR